MSQNKPDIRIGNHDIRIGKMYNFCIYLGLFSFCLFILLSTAVMAGNNTFQQKSITQDRKAFITQPKHMIFC